MLTASIAEVVSVAVSPPERGRGGPTVHTLSTLCKIKSDFLDLVSRLFVNSLSAGKKEGRERL